MLQGNYILLPLGTEEGGSRSGYVCPVWLNGWHAVLHLYGLRGLGIDPGLGAVCKISYGLTLQTYSGAALW